MNFALKTAVKTVASFAEFVNEYNIGEKDCILTNEYVLMPHLKGEQPPCFTVFQEKYGAGEPNDGMIDGIINEIGDREIDRIFAIGGGTVLDIAKILVFGKGYSCEELFTRGKDLPKVRRLIAVPTTCGTGSEVTGIAIAEIRSLHTKLGLATPQLFPDEAVLIPELLTTLPYGVFATSSIDALIHAIEAYVSINSNPYTDVFACEAIKRIIPAYRKVVESGRDKAVIAEYMEDFLIASNMAGIAFGNAGCGAVHALSYPIGANFHVPHGKANYLIFIACFRMYKEKGADLTEIEAILADLLGAEGDVWAALEQLLDSILERAPLDEFGMTAQHLAEFPDTVLKNQQRLLKNMPVQLSEEDIRNIYAACMEVK